MIISTAAESIRVVQVPKRGDIDIILEIAQSPVALIGDCLDRIDLLHHSIRPVASHSVMAGTIYPILCREGDNLAIHRALDFANPGDVLVINGFGELNRSLFGGILGEACVALGVAGVVIDGSVRDADDLDQMGLPVYARGITPAGPYRNGPGAVGDTVARGGIVCHPGDAIIGDRDGLVVMIREILHDLPAQLGAQDEIEREMRSRASQLGANTQPPAERPRQRDH